MKFYRCSTCDQVYITLVESDQRLQCCTQETEELLSSSDIEEKANHDIHIRKVGNFVTITLKEDHPMTSVHHIDFICLKTNQGFQYKRLTDMNIAKADFILAKNEEIEVVYLYCNIHLLWSKEFVQK